MVGSALCCHMHLCVSTIMLNPLPPFTLNHEYSCALSIVSHMLMRSTNSFQIYSSWSSQIILIASNLITRLHIQSNSCLQSHQLSPRYCFYIGQLKILVLYGFVDPVFFFLVPSHLLLPPQTQFDIAPFPRQRCQLLLVFICLCLRSIPLVPQRKIILLKAIV